MLDLSFLCKKKYERQHANRALSATLRYMTAMSKVIRELYWCVIHTNMKHSCQIRAGNINIFLIYGWLIAFSLASCYSHFFRSKLLSQSHSKQFLTRNYEVKSKDGFISLKCKPSLRWIFVYSCCICSCNASYISLVVVPWLANQWLFICTKAVE